jgi:hypothetical protein
MSIVKNLQGRPSKEEFKVRPGIIEFAERVIGPQSEGVQRYLEIFPDSLGTELLGTLQGERATPTE